MMIGLDFEIEPFRAALEIFNFMEVAELIYEGARAHSQNKHSMSDANWASCLKTQGVNSALPARSEKKFLYKHKNKYVYRSNIDKP